MATTVGELILERLVQWGVRRVFGYPGDGINGLIGALARAKDKMEFVQARHEELAAFMACAHAKFTGELGVCLATSGPGAIHLGAEGLAIVPNLLPFGFGLAEIVARWRRRHGRTPKKTAAAADAPSASPDARSPAPDRAASPPSASPRATAHGRDR